jgi:large subunit ribosomal protein L10
MTKNKKAEVVEELSGLFEGASGVYSIDFTGMNVANTLKLRRDFKKAGVTFKVAKNTLVQRALAGRGGFDHITDRVIGQTGIAIGYDDPAAPARVLRDFIDPKLDLPKLNFAVLEGEVYEGDRLKELASMPSRMEILGAIVGALNSPASGLVGVINAVMRDLASVIEEVAKQGGVPAPAAEAAPEAAAEEPAAEAAATESAPEAPAAEAAPESAPDAPAESTPDAPAEGA